MTPALETYLQSVDNLAKLEPRLMPKNILLEFAKLDAGELFKACSQFAILRHNIPHKEAVLTLEEEEILTLSQTYAKEIVEALRAYKMTQE